MKPFFLIAITAALTHALGVRQDGGRTGPSLTPGPVYQRLDKTDALLVMVDIQEGLINLVKDADTALYRSNILAHSGLAQVFDLPVIITTSAPAGPNGVVPKELLAMHPNATVIDRSGEVNAWDNEEFREAVRESGKSQVIVAGIATDVCTTFLALSLRQEGYGVWANADASGTTSVFVRDLANQRMLGAGVQVLSILALMSELMRSWADTPGAKELLPWIDTHFPHYGFIARAHGHAIQDGVFLPGEDVIL
ncbi:related to ycaC, hydrolase of unknown specificity [Cephalotrichum gorgonifer]|uniref:Isochorismatase-like domain-containing protein n=1 Tax=Cephalotrichum gorgonifer TaxID=2041049 RepID=A0AAE8SVQ5_9PEZI|nr:related to ycaC, hydrolase of unknown specificity [Cephalotrichum gorgonifer]